MPILDDIIDGLLKAERDGSIIAEDPGCGINLYYTCALCGEQEHDENHETFRHSNGCPLALAKQWRGATS